LENRIQRAVVLAEPNSMLVASDFDDLQRKDDTDARLENQSLSSAVEALERNLIRKALTLTKGNISRAAAQLGLSRLGLYKKLERLSIKSEKYKQS